MTTLAAGISDSSGMPQLGADAMPKRIVKTIEAAVRTGQLKQPFSKEDFEAACPGFGPGTYQAFLWKHREGNPGRNTEHFRLVRPNQFVLLPQT